MPLLISIITILKIHVITKSLNLYYKSMFQNSDIIKLRLHSFNFSANVMIMESNLRNSFLQTFEGFVIESKCNIVRVE